MKKIYSKFTKDRQVQFQIETYIAKDESGQYVAKRALTREAKAHVQNMAEYYAKHWESDMLCPAVMEGDDTIRFAFLEGRSLCKEMLGALSAHDHDAFMGCLTRYHEILQSTITGNTTEGTAAPEFAQVFGDANVEGLEMADDLDIDLTFDNIIHVGNFDPVARDITQEVSDHYQVIDYEWIFPFAVPVNYAVYRAISAFYLKYASVMQDVVTLDDMYELFLITPEQIAIFEQMNARFDAYVYGAFGAHQVLEGYRKKVYDVRQMVAQTIEEEQLYFVQYFQDCGEGYGENDSRKYYVAIPRPNQTMHVHTLIPIVNGEGVKQMRVDPLNISCALNALSLQIILQDGTTVTPSNLIHNAILTSEGTYIFANEDPQFCIDNLWGADIKSIELEFDIVSMDVLNNPALTFLTEKKGMSELKQQMRLLKAFRQKQ